MGEVKKAVLIAKVELIEEHLKLVEPDMNRVRTLLIELQKGIAKLSVA